MRIFRFLFVSLMAGSLLLTLESARERADVLSLGRELDRTLVNVVDRIRYVDTTFRAVGRLADGATLTKARALALLVEADPTILTDQSRLRRFGRSQGIDEICVSDERGVVIAGEPASRRGLDLASSRQSAAFLPAVTNRSFELVQTMQPRGGDGEVFQHAGVARRDRPGVVQIGLRKPIFRRMRMIAADAHVARTSRVRSGGRVSIGPARAPGQVGGGRPENDGEMVRAQVCNGRDISISAPVSGRGLASPGTLVLLIVVTLCLFALFVRLVIVNMHVMSKVQKLGLIVPVLAVLSLSLAFESIRETSERENVGRQLLLRLENVTSRIRSAREFSEGAVSMAQQSRGDRIRAFALLAEADPTLLADAGRLDGVRRALDTDQIAVTDGAGCVIASVPEETVGRRLAENAATAPLLAVVTNRTAELVQNAYDRTLGPGPFQYAGVSRPDRPGALILGFGLERTRRLLSLAKPLGSLTGGTDGYFVRVEPAGDRPIARGCFACEHDGRSCLCISSRCGDQMVTVGMPKPVSVLAGSALSKVLIVLAAVLFVCMMGFMAPTAVGAFAGCAKQAFAFFWGIWLEKSGSAGEGRWTAVRRVLKNPVVIVCALSYVGVLGFIWLVRTQVAESKVGRVLTAEAGLATNSQSEAIDNILFAISRAIVRHHRFPEALSCTDAADLADRYDLDEVSVVNSNGVAFVTNFGEENYVMASAAESGKFDCLLRGVQTYAQPFRGATEDPTVVRKYAGVPFPDAPGYVQVGLDCKRLTTDLRYLFSRQVAESVPSDGGFYVWTVGETGEIVATGAPQARPDDTLASIGFNVELAPEAGVPFDAELYGERCRVVWMPFAHLRVYAVLPYGAISGGDVLQTAAPILFVVFALFALLVMRLTALMNRFSDQADRLKTLMAAEKERQLRDLALAKTIQNSALPVGFPNERVFKLFAKMTAAREVGGDFYDFYPLPDGNLVFLVADASGKGVPAALFMMRAKATIRSAVFEHPTDIAEALRLSNENLANHNDAGMFVTAWVGIYHVATGEVSYVNAGHNPPVVRRADGSVEWLRGRGGMPLAAVENAPYRAGSCRLSPGDSVFLYTDGVTEAVNVAREQYGEARLEAAFRRAGKDYITAIGEDLAAFTAGAEQFDDITMLALDIPNAGENADGTRTPCP